MKPFVSPAQVLVLWGHGCNEATAAGFVTAFRGKGANVTLVALSGRRNMGAHGLTLQPDMPLSEALPLSNTANLVVIPCNVATMTALDTDPRLQELCRRATANGAGFIVCDEAVGTLLDLDADATHLFTFDLDPFTFLDG